MTPMQTTRLAPAVSTILGLTLGNFIFQAFMTKPDYAEAASRSFFECVAIVTYIALSRLVFGEGSTK